jgi:hypothetical protein
MKEGRKKKRKEGRKEGREGGRGERKILAIGEGTKGEKLISNLPKWRRS